MKKTTMFAIIIVAIINLLIFSGCASKVLYGSWQFTETIDAQTGESQEPVFSNVITMVFTINNDGTVYFMDNLFGTYEKKGKEFTFTYKSKEGDEPNHVSGAWELIGTDLYIYDDNKPLIYHLVTVQKNDEE